MNRNDQFDERAQRCINPNCGAILFVSGKMAPDTEDRGIGRDLHFKHDEKGDYIECPTCGAKHKIRYYSAVPGDGVQWNIDGLRE